MYDYLIVGSGLFGAVFAHEMKEQGKSCLVLERRGHIGGEWFLRGARGHQYPQVWCPYLPYLSQGRMGLCEQVCGVQQLCELPVANICGDLYNLPFKYMCKRS